MSQTSRTIMISPGRAARQRGVAALLAMLFLVIFASLGTAMAIVAQGNLKTADSHLKMNRSLAAAETGIRYMAFRVDQTLADHAGDFSISSGEVTQTIAADLWPRLAGSLRDDLELDGVGSTAQHALAPVVLHAGQPYAYLRVGPVRIAPGEPVFVAYLMQHPVPTDLPPGHPLEGHSYDNRYYDRSPYNAADEAQKLATGITTPVDASNPLNNRWVRLMVTAIDGRWEEDLSTRAITPLQGAVTRSVSMDLKLEKKLRAAVLSKSRVMIGRNVMVEGRIGSTFQDVHLLNGHPIQMQSDFRGIDPSLDDLLFGDPDDPSSPSLQGDLTDFDVNGDNRLAVGSEVPLEMAELDYTGDGYVDDWDLFLDHFDNSDPRDGVTMTELGASSNVTREQLFKLINEMKYPPGTQFDWANHQVKLPGSDEWVDKTDDLTVLSADDHYMKVRGEVLIAASKEDWEATGAAAEGSYRPQVQGPIRADYGEDPLTFEADPSEFPQFDQKSFDVSKYREMADGGDVLTQAAGQVGHDLDGDGVVAPPPSATPEPEPVPFGASYPYDYYDRPVFENMVFTDLYIPKGTNALFKNCTFKGVTYVETHTQNQLPHPTTTENINSYNYSGRQDRDGSALHPDIDSYLQENGLLPSGVTNTKQLGNNIRFDNCRFEGVLVSGGPDGTAAGQPDAFSHTRNKLTFTGMTEFPDVTDRTEVTGIDETERETFRRGRIITPHMSIEMGTFLEPHNNAETVQLTGTIVAGLLDMRGQVNIVGTLMTTYEPTVGDGTVMGETSPQFNTTLGYFSRDDGDLETELPPTGLGQIKLKYDPSLPLPDGIMARVDLSPVTRTYFEGGSYWGQ